MGDDFLPDFDGKQLHGLLQLAGTLTIKGLMGREHNDPDQYLYATCSHNNRHLRSPNAI
jgi:hypothetical protein